MVHAVAEIEPEFQKGITFNHGYRGGNNMRSGASAGSLRHLRQRLSVEWIAVNPFGYQTSVHTIGIRFGGDPRDEHLIDGIRQAQQLGLKVMLKPRIWLSEQDGGDWRGTIGFDTERELKEWFSNYERLLLHYAQIATQTEAEILCVGVELSRTVTDRPDDWRRLISKVREIYPGPLTYAANWWGTIMLWNSGMSSTTSASTPSSPLLWRRKRPISPRCRRGLGPLRTRSRPSTSERANPC